MRRAIVVLMSCAYACSGSEQGAPTDGDVAADTSVVGDDAADAKLDSAIDSAIDSTLDSSIGSSIDSTLETSAHDSTTPETTLAPDTRDTDVPDGPCTLDYGCHWDCLSSSGGATCVDGKVWQIGGAGYRYCCTSGAWPGPGPSCTFDTPAHVCTSGCASASPDPRYALCFPPSLPAPSELYASLCNESTFRSVGDACTSDAQCRPSATSDALKCDATSGKCVVAPRPAAPSGYGGSCGLTPSDVAASGEQVVAGKTCALCHLDFSGGSCVPQACSMACDFDEDCPDGSVCVCGGGASGADAGGSAAWRFCVATTDRTTTAGRTSWLKCP